MNMTDAVKAVFNKYATFSGRSARSEYWWWVLFTIIVSLVLGFVDAALFGARMGQVGIIGGIYSLATLIPSLAVSVRRLHDIAKSGWWLLIAFIPLIGAIVLIYWFVQRGTVGQNNFGQDPTT